MLWVRLFPKSCFKIDILVEEGLTVAKVPVAHEEKDQRAVLQGVEGSVVESVVVHWWLLVVVGKEKSLADVVVKDAEQANGPKDRKGYSMGEGAEHEVDEVGVLEIHLDVWA